MRPILVSVLIILAFVASASAGGLATLEFGQAFEGLGRLQVFDQRCNGGAEAEVIDEMRSRMTNTMAGISERAHRHADIWYELGKKLQVRDLEQYQCRSNSPSLDDIASLFQDALSYHRAGL
jgi:hypothetical protein